MAVIPNTPSAENVLRSAWMPAPPPESEPAIVSARGASAPKVIPPSRLQRLFRAAGVDADQPRLRDLADVGERRPEPLDQPGPRVVHGGRIDRRNELVVLAARQRELERITRQDLREPEEPHRDRHRGQLEACANGALRAQAREV